jgi:hypothetical protein
LANPAKLDALLRGIAGQAPESKYIRAYHGSPYDFDRFDASKIGTGQGAARYGYGYNFAGAESTADTYRKSLSALNRTPEEEALELWRRHAEMSGDPKRALLDAMDYAEGAMAEAKSLPNEDAAALWGDVMGHLYGVDYRQPLPRRPGHSYEVEIQHPERDLLDWEAPMSLQPEAVKKAYAGRGGSYRGMLDEPGDGARLWNNVKAGSRSPLQAAYEMSLSGIPGIKYPDFDPRQRGTGSLNYVMFPGTEDSIRILRKYGIMAPIAAGASSSGGQQQRGEE